jgi:hypothetical protein
MIPRRGEFAKKSIPDITKPELGEASCSLISTNKSLQVSTLAGQFRDKQGTKTSSRFFAKNMSSIDVGIGKIMQALYGESDGNCLQTSRTRRNDETTKRRNNETIYWSTGATPEKSGSNLVKVQSEDLQDQGRQIESNQNKLRGGPSRVNPVTKIGTIRWTDRSGWSRMMLARDSMVAPIIPSRPGSKKAGGQKIRGMKTIQIRLGGSRLDLSAILINLKGQLEQELFLSGMAERTCPNEFARSEMRSTVLATLYGQRWARRLSLQFQWITSTSPSCPAD